MGRLYRTSGVSKPGPELTIGPPVRNILVDRSVSVIGERYGVDMIEMTPTTEMSNRELEAWFGSAGLTVAVVSRCPEPTCEICAPSPLIEAA
jgi:hypothetical protein